MGLFSFLVGCAQAPSLKQGAFYTVDDGEGFFRVCKALVLDEQGVHVRLYKNEWKERPTIVDVSSLSLGGIDDPDGFGMGHLPVSRKEFATWRPVFVQQGTVAKDELDGYEMWKKSGGGYLGSEEVVEGHSDRASHQGWTTQWLINRLRRTPGWRLS